MEKIQKSINLEQNLKEVINFKTKSFKSPIKPLFYIQMEKYETRTDYKCYPLFIFAINFKKELIKIGRPGVARGSIWTC